MISSPVLAMAQVALADCYLDLGDGAKARVLAATAKHALESHREVGAQYLRPFQTLEKRLREVNPRAKHG